MSILKRAKNLSNSKIALFVDGSNLYATTRQLGFMIDWSKVIPYFEKYGKIIRAAYYTALYKEEDGSIKILPTIDYIGYNGFVTVTKEAKSYASNLSSFNSNITNNNPSLVIKGNLDVEIATDAIAMSERMDEFFLFSGDGDFTYLVNTLRQRGIRTTIVSSLKTRDRIVSNDLRRSADAFIDLKDLQPDLELKKRHEPR